MASRPGPEGASASEDRKRCGSSSLSGLSHLIRSLVRYVRLIRRSPFPLARVHLVSIQGPRVRCRFTTP